MVGTLCVQVYTNQFETLQALLSWSVDVYMVLHDRQFNFCHFF